MSLLARGKRGGCSIVMTKKTFSIPDIKKFLKTKGFIISKKKNKNIIGLESLPKTFLSSLIIISIFFITPLTINLSKEKMNLSKDYENTSKNNLKKLLDNDLDTKFLFEDILSFDETPKDSIRLSASTIEELFKSTNYSLDDVRKNKLVKPISLTLLPTEITKIENVKKRKDFFIQIILPLVIAENNNIKLDRKKLFIILNKNKNSKAEQSWLNSKFKQYGVTNKDLATLKVRMDEIPTSMIIAQAAKETGWGTSRFAQEGNALFGQWTWSGEGIKPANADKDTTHKIMKFNVLQASVKAYQRNLNTHSSYRNFRSARAEMRDNGEKLDSTALTEYLDSYAETGKEYVKALQQIIRQNNLADFDDAKLLPSSIELKSLI